MSKKCMDFLYNSFLYSYSACEQIYSGYTDKEINEELQKYRNYVLDNSVDIRSEIKNENDKLNACFESWHQLPDEKLFRHMVLYMDQVVITDPVFELTEKPSSFSNASAELLGFQSHENIDRKKIVDSINSVRSIVMLIEAEFVVMLPLTLMHEAPKEIPILYSPSAFSDIIPKEILEYLRSIAKVSILERTDKGLQVLPDNPKLTGTSILIDFIDEDKLTGSLYQYINTKVLEYDEKTGKATLVFRPADSITTEQFTTWVNQSINQSANKHFNAIYKEIVFSKECNCMYLTQSPIVSNILNKIIKTPSVESKIATMALDIDLPITSHIPLKELLTIRKDYGTAFSNFRSELNRKLLSLDAYADADSLKHQIDSISYELNNLQVQEVEKEYRKIIRTLKLDAIALTGSLIATFTSGGLTAVGAAGAFLKGISDIAKYFTEVHENNGYFLWRVSRKDKKITI